MRTEGSEFSSSSPKCIRSLSPLRVVTWNWLKLLLGRGCLPGKDQVRLGKRSNKTLPARSWLCSRLSEAEEQVSSGCPRGPAALSTFVWNGMNSVHGITLDPDTQQEYSFREKKGAPMSGATRAKQLHVALQAERLRYLFKQNFLELYLLKIIE